MTLLVENLYIPSNNDPKHNPNPNPNHEKNTKNPNSNPQFTSQIQGTTKLQSIVVLSPKIDKFVI